MVMKLLIGLLECSLISQLGNYFNNDFVIMTPVLHVLRCPNSGWLKQCQR
jgi:hypothetical protein